MIRKALTLTATLSFSILLTVATYSQSAEEAKTQFEALRAKISEISQQMHIASSEGNAEEYDRLKAEYDKLTTEGARLNTILSGDAETKRKINGVRNLYNDGTTALKLRRYDEAIGIFQNAVNDATALNNPLLNDTIVKSYYNMAQAYSLQKKWAQTKETIEKSITIDPNFERAYFMLGLAHQKMSNTSSAIDSYIKARNLNPNYTKAHYNLGVIYFTTKNYQGAIKEFTEVIKLEATHAKAFNYLGRAYFERNEYNSAVTAFRQSITLKHSDQEPHWFLARSLNKLGSFQQAKNAADALVKLKPNYGGGYMERGIAYKGIGNKSAAIADFQQAAKDRNFKQQAEYEIKWYDKG